MLSALLGLIPGVFTTINGITAAISNERVAALTASTDQQRIESEERINTLQARRDVLIQDASKSSLDILVRSTVALIASSVILKLMFWDKVIGSFVGCNQDTSSKPDCSVFITDPLDSNMWMVITAVIGFYFLSSTITNIKK